MRYGKRKSNLVQREWQQALQEGRVLRAYGELTFTLTRHANKPWPLGWLWSSATARQNWFKWRSSPTANRTFQPDRRGAAACAAALLHSARCGKACLQTNGANQ